MLLAHRKLAMIGKPGTLLRVQQMSEQLHTVGGRVPGEMRLDVG